ncbi:aldehyde dehydrogenase [Moniliophthora roreri MCA 2997]|uniref:Aldehyde dehydrogenase n=1 Tax=Moniliophthora roreri (strain MCA 2997) TaxID=1381753 RepID=V2YY74_MONRO|nr:aldehyde dehydrogenase [Moniliophthora roreri MCA 2997]
MSNIILLHQLKAAFDTGLSRPVSWRRKQLEGIHGAVQANLEKLVNAAVQDERLVRTEVLLELDCVLDFIKSKLDELVSNANTNFNYAKSDIGLGALQIRKSSRYTPAGVVLIQSSWAYPYSSLLIPAVSAFAAGNVCAFVASSIPAVAKLLSSTFSTFLDQNGHAFLDVSSSDEETHLFDTPTPSVSVLDISITSSKVGVVKVSTTPSDSSVAYVHESGNIKAAAREITDAKLAFNGLAPRAPSVVLVDYSVYDEFRAQLIDAAGSRHNLPSGRLTSSAKYIEANGTVVVASDPLTIVEVQTKDARSTLSTVGHLPYLVVCRVSSPDTAIDRIATMSKLSTFVLYAAEPFRTYVNDNVDSKETLWGALPVELLGNPWGSSISNLSLAIAEPQEVVQVTKSSQKRLVDFTIVPSLENAIAKSWIPRVDEGPGTRIDFFQQVGMVFKTVKFAGLLAVATTGYVTYRHFTR